MLKKESEKEILSKVYDLDKYNVKCSEQPDFIIGISNNGSKTFGVEITKNYLHDGYAMLNNIPGYINNVLDSKNKDKRDESLFDGRILANVRQTGYAFCYIPGIFTVIQKEWHISKLPLFTG